MTSQPIRRSGPMGRVARLGLATVFGLTLYAIVDSRGSARFRNPHILGEPSAWVLHLAMFSVFVILVGAVASAIAGPALRRRWQIRAVVALVALLVSAAGIGLLTHRSAWGFPLADLVWWFDVLLLCEQLIASLLAIALGTPGCEIGVWPELLSRVRGRAIVPEDGLACIVGLHLIDRWEARRGHRWSQPSPRKERGASKP